MKTNTPRPLRILMVAAEAAPLAKVGGLADVVGTLPIALRRIGHDVRLIMPFYKTITAESTRQPAVERHIEDDPVLSSLEVEPTISCIETQSGLPVYLVGLDRWFGNSRRSEDIYTSDPAAYIAFCRVAAVIASRGTDGWVPDVVHSHDWHAGLVAPYLRWMKEDRRRPTVHTVHNLAYAGVFGRDVFDMAGFPTEAYTMDGLEYYGGFSFLKAGMVYSDMTTTVSPTYAREVETDEFGGGLAGLVRYLKSQRRFTGILNGIDTDVHDPERDPALPVHYSAEHEAGKQECKAALQAECGLDPEPRAPLVGMVSRICEQKGHDLVAACADRMVAAGCQLVVLGVGDAALETSLVCASSRHPGRVAVKIGYDAYLAPRIYAGSDMFLMPSRFEPCGLGQLIALRYGAVPIVRRTGGLADTVRDIGERPRAGNGFVFDDMTPEAMLGALDRALALFTRRDAWKRLMVRGMREDHSWPVQASRYEALYRSVQRRRSA